MDCARIQQSPFPLGPVLAESWKVFAGRFWTILIIALIVYVPVEVVIAVFAPNPENGYALRDLAQSIRVSSFMMLLVGTLLPLAIGLLVEGELTGRRVDWWQAMRHALSRWRSGVATNFLKALALMATFLLLIVPGIIYSVYFAFAICAVAIRGQSLRAALSYSKSLVKGRWWTVFGVMLVAWLMMIAWWTVTGIAREEFAPAGLALDVVAGLVGDVGLTLFAVVSVVYFLALDAKAAEPQAATPPESAGAPADRDAMPERQG